MFKFIKGLSPVIFGGAFPVRQQSQYSMRNYSPFAMPRVKMVNHGLESLSYIGSIKIVGQNTIPYERDV